MGKAIAKGLFYLFAFIVVAWMVTNTKGMLDMVFPGNAIIPWLGLAVFDVGAVAWLVVFLRDASGTGQRSVSIVSSLVSLIGAILMTVAHLYMGGQTITDVPAEMGTYVIWAIGIMTALHATAVWSYHVLDPLEMMEIKQKMGEDRIIALAYKKAEAEIDDRADVLATHIGRTWADNAGRRVQETTKVLQLNGVDADFPKDAPAQPTPLQLADSGTSPTNGKRPSTPKSV